MTEWDRAKVRREMVKQVDKLLADQIPEPHQRRVTARKMVDQALAEEMAWQN
jgi:hypothetical protein